MTKKKAVCPVCGYPEPILPPAHAFDSHYGCSNCGESFSSPKYTSELGDGWE